MLSEDIKNDWTVKGRESNNKSTSINLTQNFDHESVVCGVKFSKNANYLATGCSRIAQIFDCNNGNRLHVFRHISDNSDPENTIFVRSVDFSPDGKFLATGAEDKTIKIWDIETERVLKNFEGHEAEIYFLEYSPDGSFLVSGSGDKTVKVWNIEQNICMRTLKSEMEESDGITSVAISHDGRFIAAGSLDHFIKLWDTETGRMIHQFEGHSDAVYSVVFSPDGKNIATGSLDKTVKIWDLNEKQCRNTLVAHRDFVLSIAYVQDGNWLLSGSKDRTIHFWDLRTYIPEFELRGHRNSIISVAVSNSETLGQGKCATGSGDYKARIWQFTDLN